MHAAVAAKGRSLSQVSHELTGRYGTMAAILDTQEDTDLRFWIAEDLPDRLY